LFGVFFGFLAYAKKLNNDYALTGKTMQALLNKKMIHYNKT
jgi:hypothetical protein